MRNKGWKLDDVDAEFDPLKKQFCCLGGGGGGGSTTSTSYQTNLPEYAQPFYEEMMTRAQKESIQPYQAYTGDRTADPSQMQADVRTEAAGMTDPTGLGMAQTGLNALQAAGPSSYTAGTFDAATAQAGMDPYMQAVVNEQKKQIQQDYNRQKAGRAAQAVQAGAFGGGRAGAEEAIAEGEMIDRMAMAQAQGLQQAYGASREEFAQAEQRKQQQAQSAQQAEQMQMQVAQAQQGLATAQQALQESRLKLQNAVGAEEKAEAQKELDLKYEEFLNARDNERQNLAFYNALLRGIPVPTQSQVVQYQPSAGIGSQIAGLGIAGLGAYNAMS